MENAHIYVPGSYLLPPSALFSQAYPGWLQTAEFLFAFENLPLSSANQNPKFQEARKQLMELEPVFPESFEEMDMSIKAAGLKLKMEGELKVIRAGVTWISAFTLIHQVGAFLIKPINLFPLLPCAFGIGGMIYQGWKLQDEIIELLADSPENAAILVHQLSSEVLYNKERRKYLSGPEKWMITSTGNDWLHDLLAGPISRKLAIAQSCLLTQLAMSKQDGVLTQGDLEKHLPKQSNDQL